MSERELSRACAAYSAVILRACGVSSTLRLLGSIIDVSGILAHPLSRVTTLNVYPRSRDALRPSFAGNFCTSPIRGRRECRMRAAPAVSCAMGRRSAHMSIQVQREHPGLPCAMALRLITCSPRRTALLPPLRPEKQLPPGALTPAPRRQDHTPLPYASAALVFAASASTAPRPTFVTIASAPLAGTGWR